MRRRAASVLPLDIEKYPAIPVRFLLWLADYKQRRKPPDWRLRHYQVRFIEKLFYCWKHRRDLVAKQSRQTGKTVLVGLFLSYMIIEEECQGVIVSTKTQKTKKIARIVQAEMRSSGRKRDADGVVESRFEGAETGFVCLSGNVEAQREGDTAHIVVVDEGQDIQHDGVYEDLSPMRAGVNGIMVILGIGGAEESMIETVSTLEDVEILNITATEVQKEIPHYERNMLRDRKAMTHAKHQAHYFGVKLPSASENLLPRIIRWDQAHPGVVFNPNSCSHITIGFDWGKRMDKSAILAIGKIRVSAGPTQHVIFAYEYMDCGYVEQLDRAMSFLDRVPYDSLRPELNNIGDALADFLDDRLTDEARRRMSPHYKNDRDSQEALQAVCVCSQQGNLLYVDDDGLAESAVDDLRKIKVKYTLGTKMQASHSDWGAALLCAFYPERTAEVQSAA